MLMYLTLSLFAIAIILVAAVWYTVNGKIKDGESGGASATLEEVEESPSDAEKEFEALDKEIKGEES
jgi:cell division protein FtsL